MSLQSQPCPPSAQPYRDLPDPRTRSPQSLTSSRLRARGARPPARLAAGQARVALGDPGPQVPALGQHRPAQGLLRGLLSPATKRAGRGRDALSRRRGERSPWAAAGRGAGPRRVRPPHRKSTRIPPLVPGCCFGCGWQDSHPQPPPSPGFFEVARHRHRAWRSKSGSNDSNEQEGRQARASEDGPRGTTKTWRERSRSEPVCL